MSPITNAEARREEKQEKNSISRKKYDDIKRKHMEYVALVKESREFVYLIPLILKVKRLVNIAGGFEDNEEYHLTSSPVDWSNHMLHHKRILFSSKRMIFKVTVADFFKHEYPAGTYYERGEPEWKVIVPDRPKRSDIASISMLLARSSVQPSDIEYTLKELIKDVKKEID